MADEENEQSPFSRPSFIVAAVLVAALVVAGVVVGVNIATRDNGNDANSAPSTTTSAAPSAEPTADAGGASVCGLSGTKTEGKLTSAPNVDEWAFEGTTTYPSSSKYGPAATDEAGRFKYCFQQSPEGAVYAATYAVAVATDQSLVPAWIDYFAAPGPYRDEFLTTAESPTTPDENSARLRVEGFRLLSYDGTTARVDLGVTLSAQNKVANASFIYNLVWSEGDWKIDTSTAEPGSFSTIPDLSGYVPWGE